MLFINNYNKYGLWILEIIKKKKKKKCCDGLFEDDIMGIFDPELCNRNSFKCLCFLILN